MSEVMNLPESLERLALSPEKAERCEHGAGSKEENRCLNNNDEPERILESLSINDVSHKGACSCRRRETRCKELKRLETKKRSILRKSKLSPVLRAPVLRIPGSSGSDSTATTPVARFADGLRPLSDSESCSSRLDDDDTLSQSNLALPDGRQSTSSGRTCCAVQARLTAQATPPPPEDDPSMDELASYFEYYVHIPKKMSRMAEMMYI